MLVKFVVDNLSFVELFINSAVLIICRARSSIQFQLELNYPQFRSFHHAYHAL
jgi:hypothetical protein